jgi:Fe2+ or Zn2+ uptake regulation protein
VLLAQMHMLHIITEQEHPITSASLVKALADRGQPVSLRRVQRYMNTFVALKLVTSLPGDAVTNYGGRRYVKSGKLALTWEPES